MPSRRAYRPEPFQQRKIVALRAVLLAALLGVTAPAGAAPVFQGLGDLPGGDIFFSRAHAISADGSTVVGTSHGEFNGQTGYQAFRWTAATGMVPLGDLKGGDFESIARAVSADGSVIVGTGTSVGGEEAFRWTAASEMKGLGDLAGGGFHSDAFGISADGSVIVGTGNSGTQSIGREAVRWVGGGGPVGLGDLTDSNLASFGYGISADGTVVVGSSYGDGPGNPDAIKWTTGDGMVSLGGFAGIPASLDQANAASADGSVIVGTALGTSGLGEAFRWTAATGMVALTPGILHSEALAVSADGSVVVGVRGGTAAFIWDELLGTRLLEDVLADDFGLDLAGWSLQQATGISADGQVIVGYGRNPAGDVEGWIADLGGTTFTAVPAPPAVALFALGLLALRFCRHRLA